jgi:SepF-like predicted cell division protein (DUF552 family)
VKSLATSEQENKTEKKAYFKAMPLRSLEDVEVIKHELSLGNFLVLKITPLARKSVEDVKKAVNELYAFTQSIGGDIARLGEERIVVVPSSVKIWRQETGVPQEKASTAA